MTCPDYSEIPRRKQDRSYPARQRGLGFALAVVLAVGITVRLLVLASYLEAVAQWTGHGFTRYAAGTETSQVE